MVDILNLLADTGLPPDQRTETVTETTMGDRDYITPTVGEALAGLALLPDLDRDDQHQLEVWGRRSTKPSKAAVMEFLDRVDPEGTIREAASLRRALKDYNTWDRVELVRKAIDKGVLRGAK